MILDESNKQGIIFAAGKKGTVEKKPLSRDAFKIRLKDAPYQPGVSAAFLDCYLFSLKSGRLGARLVISSALRTSDLAKAREEVPIFFYKVKKRTKEKDKQSKLD
jgi:hypothetical protein